jgi:hypothetical protein
MSTSASGDLLRPPPADRYSVPGGAYGARRRQQVCVRAQSGARRHYQTSARNGPGWRFAIPLMADRSQYVRERAEFILRQGMA